MGARLTDRDAESKTPEWKDRSGGRGGGRDRLARAEQDSRKGPLRREGKRKRKGKGGGCLKKKLTKAVSIFPFRSRPQGLEES